MKFRYPHSDLIWLVKNIQGNILPIKGFRRIADVSGTRFLTTTMFTNKVKSYWEIEVEWHWTLFPVYYDGRTVYNIMRWRALIYILWLWAKGGFRK